MPNPTKKPAQSGIAIFRMIDLLAGEEGKTIKFAWGHCGMVII